MRDRVRKGRVFYERMEEDLIRYRHMMMNVQIFRIVIIGSLWNVGKVCDRRPVEGEL